MEAAIGAANWLLKKVLKKLSDDLVASYMASSELGLNFEKIKIDLAYTQGLLDAAEERDVGNNRGLRVLLDELTKKADEAEDTLDELHYFIIQDQIDGTHEATPVVDSGIHGHVLLGCHALCDTIGNLFPCFTCSHAHDKLAFNRVAMSNKMKSGIEGIHTLCDRVSRLLSISHTTGIAASLKRPPTSSSITQHILHGREDIFNQTLDEMIICNIHSAPLSVLPIVGPGGIGKTTFAQHLYNDERIQAHFSFKVWVSVPTNFDVLKLTQEIFNCIYHTENDARRGPHEPSNLDQLQKFIAQRLKSNTFLLVLDDMWKCDSETDWKTLLAPFTKGETKGNMILVTTRFPSIAQMVKTNNQIQLKGLEHEEFFAFFKECIFDDDKDENYDNDLIDIAIDISMKLKGFPLAAKTVGRLLKNNLSQERWMEVLERDEWKYQQSEDDIMPALKISYDYLPFYLKKCFSYFALYPKDQEFNSLEITHFWEAIGTIDSGEQNNKAEDVGIKYLDELVGNGFLVKLGDGKRQYYEIHDLLHELAQKVSSHECINIGSYSFRSDSIPRSIRHVAITQNDKFDHGFEGEIERLKGRIDVGSLRTLMFSVEYNETVPAFFKHIFKETKCLRVLFISEIAIESFPYNFSKLIHLRYLKIESCYGLQLCLSSTICRLYHLKFLDIGYGIFFLPKDITCLVNLRHFLAENASLSSVPGIGKMKYLQELKEFHVKREEIGFELRELGELTELGGELTIYNLRKVATREEASDAKLMLKRNLKRLALVWGAEQRTTGSNVLDGLQPHPYLEGLEIRNPGGSTGPSWLCGDISFKGLTYLHLEGISWGTLPPFGQLKHLEKLTLINIAGIRQFGAIFCGITPGGALRLKNVELTNMPELVEWVGGAHYHLFQNLASISCVACPNLSTLLLPSCECSDTCAQDKNTIWFPNLCSLKIRDCPKLLLPPMPHTTMLTFVTVKQGYQDKFHFEAETLRLHGYDGALAFHNLGKVQHITIEDMSHVSLTGLQKLNSLTSLVVRGLSSEVDDDVIFPSVQKLSNYFLTSLTRLKLTDCENLTADGFDPLVTRNLNELVVYNNPESDNHNHHCSIAVDLFSEVARTKIIPAGSFQQLQRLKVDSILAVLVAPICSLLAATLSNLIFKFDLHTESFTEEQEHALQLLTSLRELDFCQCLRLQSLPEGLYHLSSLRDLKICACPEIRSLPKMGLPASLDYLNAWECNIELEDELEKLKASNPDFIVQIHRPVTSMDIYM